MSAALKRRIRKVEREQGGDFLTLIDFIRHWDTGEPMPDKPIDPALVEFLEKNKDVEH